MKFVLGKKQYMTQLFNEKGHMLAATVVSVLPLKVTQVKNKENDGYDALQLAAFPKKKNAGKAIAGHLKASGVESGNFEKISEVRLEDATDKKVGDTIDVSIFAEGDKVEISGISKGKGFQGVVKRHGFHGGPRTHGNAHAEREPGSISGGLRTHVPKNMRMAGRMGGDRITVKNLYILKVFPETNEIVISGAIPGRRGTFIEIRAI